MCSNRRQNKIWRMKMETKYCLCVKQDVKISQYNKNGKCQCLNCSKPECIGVPCDDFPPNNCTDAIDYFKGVNSLCIQCRGAR